MKYSNTTCKKTASSMKFGMGLLFSFLVMTSAEAQTPTTGSSQGSASTQDQGVATAQVVPADSGAVPNRFRAYYLGMPLEELKKALAADDLFLFRGDRDVSLLPVREQSLIETTGLSFIRRAFFQLREGKLFVMSFSLNLDKIDHYSVFTSLTKKYGEPDTLNPQEAVWIRGNVRLSLERPLTIKYIDLTVFNTIIEESKVGASREARLREEFLNDL
ncbi:MAG TPA: hypothetical protein PLW34_06565 [Termitinemataceae bacterium]|uniref:hypothetical protein n=1 Tax=Treponema sp. J25 TaxID=2094121 RepID=UPI0010446690|nr:hypothetical protein [Treponema sp. J25]HOJ99204.1 hypothetical protein [Termitinemataceae bacterium]HOM23912.1 hypothetical protein [Termitinemataceae bacterium]HPQ00985.1 hypothetical protein [Termitinemataceae bacterium]